MKIDYKLCYICKKLYEQDHVYLLKLGPAMKQGLIDRISRIAKSRGQFVMRDNCLCKFCVTKCMDCQKFVSMNAAVIETALDDKGYIVGIETALCWDCYKANAIEYAEYDFMDNYGDAPCLSNTTNLDENDQLRNDENE